MTGFDRRDFIHAGLGGLAAVAVSSTGASAKMERPARPNVLFIMADDLGYGDLSCTGSRHIQTPAIDSLAAGGLLLRQGYANSAICSPTRTALMTGCYQYRFSVGLEEPIGPGLPEEIHLPSDRAMLPGAFRSLGYRTKLIGKWHLGDPPEKGPLKYGYDQFLGIVEGGADYFHHHMMINNQKLGMGLMDGATPTERNGYLTDIFGQQAAQFVSQKSAQPFFLSLHFTAPHWPWEGPEDERLAEQIGSSFHMDGGNLDTYRQMMESLDRNIAVVLKALEDAGELDNTIIIFTSDNGGERFSDTWPFVGMKGELLEGGVRVPIIMRWPGKIAPGSRSEQVMTSMDFLPTLLGLANAAPPKGAQLDGIDLSRQIAGTGQIIPRELYWRLNSQTQASMRDGDWKYLRIAEKEYLFDLAADERERADRSQAEPERFAAMRERWAAWNSTMLPYRPGSSIMDPREHYTDRY